MDGLIALALAKKNIKGVTKTLAEEYNSEKEYVEGALVIKDGKLQKYVDGEWVETVITENLGGGDIQQSEEEHIGEVIGGTAAPIDTTLSIAGAAADAKVTGEGIADLQEQIDAITSATDVRDVVADYAALQAYDTSILYDNDIVKVLSDSTHSNAIAYYRWIITEGTGAWSYIGTQGPFYTKSETDNLLNGKQSTISDISTIRDNASNGKLAYNRLSNDLNYIELTAEDSETHEVITFKIFGSEIEEGGGV